jgi:preprotein translocase subunit SecA
MQKELNTTAEHWRTLLDDSREMPTGLDTVVHGMVGRFKRRRGILRDLLKEADRIDALSPEYEAMTDPKLREALRESRYAFRRNPGRVDKRTLRTTFAALREAAYRCTGLRPYKVQLAGGLALYHGYLIEMATGEGKTLVAGLAAVPAGWSRRPCHVVTVNDYLAQRDAEWFKSFYHFCDLNVGTVLAQMDPEERRKEYAADVTYTTSKELLGDFLRDRLRLGSLENASRRHVTHMLNPRLSQQYRASLVMRGIHTVIVDEADSVLIDEAVTPLIISKQTENFDWEKAAFAARDIAAKLEQGRDFRVEAKYKDLHLTERGKERVAEMADQLDGIWQSKDRRVELIEQALVAREFFLKDHQYVIQEDKVVIVDEFTGRLMPQRTWRHGLHQAIEAKEDMKISPPSETMSRLSFQRFFRFFNKLSGMTGTASEAQKEIWQIYRLPVIPIPTNRPCIRKVRRDRVFPTVEKKWDAVVEEVIRIHETNRPVLIGTRSVQASQELAERLEAVGMAFCLLNAVHHRDEAEIVMEAGNPGRVTIATNMAGRGTDIKLGEGVADLGGLHVIATERHESHRIDRQLFGRCARQGDPGDAQAFISLEDGLFERFFSKNLMKSFLSQMTRFHIPGSSLLVTGAVLVSQSAAQHQAFKQRKQVLKMDLWLQESLSFAKASDQLD